ncbi:D-alanyl-D-alanine carboxypeptidase / D-alanyl-D-alanine-endopeptidase (penicillin-binding protein 4) [Nitrosovibrio sp. Nv17]|nr:D-alanyl-D-alanine carboxypeptidase / D-alanyl-D-alanine-endopeptidase (penicillin-binding protein 4) [Nitrosovibrio sp. Nv17]
MTAPDLRRPRQALMLGAMLFLLPLPARPDALPLPVSQALRQAGIPLSGVGIYVHEIDASEPLLAVNAGAPMNPASVMKLITTFAGLELLGPAHTWKTEIYADGTLDGDTLRGDLVMKGYGDPKLNLENFWLLTRRLRQTGLREVTGDLVLDTRHFSLPGGGPGDFDGKPHRAYNVLPEPLLVNHGALALRLTPQLTERTVRVAVDPLLPSLDLRNDLALTHGPCNTWSDTLAPDIRTLAEGGLRASITLRGDYSADCGEKTLYFRVYDTQDYVFGLFKQLWEEQGGQLRGSARSGMAPDGVTPLVIHRSPPLADIVRDINKFSNNTAARQLYLALGAASHPEAGTGARPAGPCNACAMAAGGEAPPATLAASEQALRRWLASRQLSFPGFVVENGSGLSRNERISPEHLGMLLRLAFQSRVMPEFISSLPIAAVDGTMKKRLADSAVAGQAHVKTGSLSGVKTMAGYVLERSGRRAVVVFLVNHPRADAAQAAMDALLRWVCDRS